MPADGKPPRVLAVAGSDSSGGAGIQADIKAVTMLGGYAMTAITAVTAQNTRGVHAVHTHDAKLVGAQIDACVGDIGVDAVKIGMLGSAAIADCVADRLDGLNVPIVFDPVMVATSGAALADPETIAAFERLMGMATLTTPNVAELKALGGPQALTTRGIAVFAKGGDAGDDAVTDRLYRPNMEAMEWSAPRIDTRHTHGTGCTVSSAIATFLAMGLTLPEAIAKARIFVRLALRDAPGFGAQAGPMGHQTVRIDLTGEPRLNQIALGATNYDAAVRFYRTIGLTLIVDSPTNGYARFESPGGATLSVSTGHEVGSGAVVYFECTDLDAQIERLAAVGIVCPAPHKQSWNWRESWTADPAGNRICFYEAGEDRRYPPWRVN